MKKLREFFPYIIILVVILLVKTFVFTTVRVNGNSMYGTLHDKDIMILDKIGYRFHEIERFDIVVVNRNGERLIKRVIALPGEKISYQNNVLYIDGKKVEDPYNQFDRGNFESQLKSDEYFVMGDNRKDSLDSFYFGPIHQKQILGRATFTIFPFNRIGGAK